MTQQDERLAMAITGLGRDGRWYITVHDRTAPVREIVGGYKFHDYPEHYWPTGHGAPSQAAREEALMEMGWERVAAEAWEYSEIEPNGTEANWGLLTRVKRLPAPAPVSVEDLVDTTGQVLQAVSAA